MLLRLTVCMLAAALSLAAANTTVRYTPADPEVGPFPSDALTVPDATQKTGQRVNLPLPDCTQAASTCLERGAINQLDGFNPQARIHVRFSGPINPNTLRDGLWIVTLNNLSSDEYGLTQDGQPIPVNQVVYDPATHTAYAKPDAFLDQHRRYAIVVSNAIYDAAGDPVVADPAYTACVAAATAAASTASPACAGVAEVARVAADMFFPRRIVASSVFTTLSATAWLEKARDHLQSTPPAFTRGPSLLLSSVRSLVWRQEVGIAPPRYLDVPIPVELLVGVRSMAFGSYTSTRYLNDALAIPQTPTAQDLAQPPSLEQIGFNVYLPASPKPAGGYPVVIFGHGITSDRFFSPGAAAPVMAAAGFAVIAIDAVGHGFGPDSQLVATDSSGKPTVIPAPGRGVSTSGDGSISPGEGCIVLLPVPIGLRDCLRQTALDISQLVRMIRAGVDLDGDGAVDLDPTRIYYIGQSLGAMYGTLVSAIEPRILASTLNVGGGSVADVVRWSPGFRAIAALYFAVRQPRLLNKGADYDENYVLRYRPVDVNTVAGAIDIQNEFEVFEWIGSPGDPLAFAPHLRSSTLPGVQIKPVLFQYGYGDQTVPNPTQTALVRAANMRESTWFYRLDRARQVFPSLGRNPHTYLLDILTPAGLPIAVAAQGQAAAFFLAGGASIVDANSLLPLQLGQLKLFEVPGFLTEDLNFIP